MFTYYYTVFKHRICIPNCSVVCTMVPYGYRRAATVNINDRSISWSRILEIFLLFVPFKLEYPKWRLIHIPLFPSKLLIYKLLIYKNLIKVNVYFLRFIIPNTNGYLSLYNI